MNDFGKKLKAIRIQKGLTQEQLANAIGSKHRQVIDRLEAGNRIPSGLTLQKLITALSVSPEYFFY